MFLKAGGAGAEVEENLNDPIIEDITAPSQDTIENPYQDPSDEPGPAGCAAEDEQANGKYPDNKKKT
eukprot:2553894-Rhodomonas_salina.1